MYLLRFFCLQCNHVWSNNSVAPIAQNCAKCGTFVPPYGITKDPT